MELRPYIDALRHELALAAATGGEDARELAERLTAPLESAVRLALLDALSEAATEITRDLAPGSVDLRLRNREPSFVVTLPPADPWTDQAATSPPAEPTPAPAPAPAAGEDEATVRISLRLPENLKNRVEQAAARAGVSINTWLIRAAAAAADRDGGSSATVTAASGSQRFTGWVR
ncbi:ribbon-helix-helix protein, CopG family [Actinoplanes sp. NPDC024001]|uniref:ribbon-helix-helix protein, CopG family n=1 Tax=Actinoplanes sp. NPDC024001 TaxID=3154598 RepID=UPI0033E1B0CB